MPILQIVRKSKCLSKASQITRRIWNQTCLMLWLFPLRDVVSKDGNFTWWITSIYLEEFVCACVFSHLFLWDPVNYSPPGFSVHEISQARILEWVAISYSRGSSWPRVEICVFCISFIGRRILNSWVTWEALEQFVPTIFFRLWKKGSFVFEFSNILSFWQFLVFCLLQYKP